MNEVAVHLGLNELDAQTAAGALRARDLHPRVIRDPMDPMLGIAGRLGAGRFIVLVPEAEADAARSILTPRGRRRRRR